MHIACKNRGVKYHRQGQPAGHIDIAQAQGIHLRFAGKAFALLGHVHMESHIVQAVLRQALKPRTGEQYAIGKQRGPQALGAHVAHDLGQLIFVP